MLCSLFAYRIACMHMMEDVRFVYLSMSYGFSIFHDSVVGTTFDCQFLVAYGVKC